MEPNRKITKNKGVKKALKMWEAGLYSLLHPEDINDTENAPIKPEIKINSKTQKTSFKKNTITQAWWNFIS